MDEVLAAHRPAPDARTHHLTSAAARVTATTSTVRSSSDGVRPGTVDWYSSSSAPHASPTSTTVDRRASARAHPVPAAAHASAAPSVPYSVACPT